MLEQIHSNEEHVADDVLDTAPIQKVQIQIEGGTIKSYLVDKYPESNIITEKYQLPTTVMELRPIDKLKWHGKKGNMDFDKGISMECAVDKGKFLTGMTEEETKYLEAISGYALNNTFNLNIPHPFYQTQIGKLKLPNEVVLLDLSNPLDYIKFKFATQHFLVADSLEDGLNNHKPLATHYIHNEESVNDLEISRAQTIKEADKLFATMNPIHMKHLYVNIFETDARLLSDDSVESKLILFKQQNVVKFLDMARLPKDQLLNRSSVITAVSRNIIQLDGQTYKFDGMTLGYSVDEAAKAIGEPQNQELKLRIINQIQNK